MKVNGVGETEGERVQQKKGKGKEKDTKKSLKGKKNKKMTRAKGRDMQEGGEK